MTKKEDRLIRTKRAWPTKDAMQQVYTQKLWGGHQVDFYSGEGSHLTYLVQPYVDVVTAFLTSFDQPLVVSDLGCGDFNVGVELVKHSKKYVAVDIVANLIDRNKTKFHAENLEFHCLDIAADELPVGDCVLLRQVLQHLSNAEVLCIVSKLYQFKYVIVTEHIPEGDFIPNKDIISGQGIRLKMQSGVDLLAAPFNLKVKAERQLLSILLKDGKGMVRTTLYEVF